MRSQIEERPAGQRGDSKDLGDGHHDDTPSAAVFFRNSYAVLVRGKSVRRHLYFNLPAAERCVARALNRGDHAELILVRLVPADARHLDHLDGGEADD